MLSGPEYSFYRVLLTVLEPHELLAVKVRLADLAHVDKARYPDGSPEESRAFWAIAAHHVDFVLCDRRTLQPLLAIELDGATHQTHARQIASDTRKERVLQQIG